MAAAICTPAVPAAAQERHEHPDCRGLPFWHYAVGHWHYPEILAELTQQNGPRSAEDLDALAQELARSAAEPDSDWVVEQIRTHWEHDIRAGAEEAARKGICYDERDVDRMVAEAIEDYRRDPVERARGMAQLTLRLAAHRRDMPSHPAPAGIPYAGAFEAALVLFEETGSDAELLDELDPKRAAEVFERAALRPGPRACDALRAQRWGAWGEGEGDEQYTTHPSYQRLRRASPEPCPELDDPDSTCSRDTPP